MSAQKCQKKVLLIYCMTNQLLQSPSEYYLVVLHVLYMNVLSFLLWSMLHYSDEKIPMNNHAAYTIVNISSEKPMVLKETTAEADYENPDAVL